MNTFTIVIPDDKDTKYTSFRYPAGELQVRIKPEQIPVIMDADTICVKANITNGEVMELALLTSAILGIIDKRTVLPRMILGLPYLPYARADRRFVPGDCLGIKTFADIINSLDYDSVHTYDAHSKVSELAFDRLENHDIYDNIAVVLGRIETKKLAFLLPDEGAKRYNLEQFNLPVFQAKKVRDPETGKLSGFDVPLMPLGDEIPEGILIIDDICDGGGTFIGLAQEIKKLHTKAKLYLYVTHGIFSQGSKTLMKNFDRVFYSTTFKSPYLKEKKEWNLIQSFTSIFTK